MGIGMGDGSPFAIAAPANEGTPVDENFSKPIHQQKMFPVQLDRRLLLALESSQQLTPALSPPHPTA